MTALPEPETFEEAVERLVAAAEDQGLSRHVTDPATLDRLAGLVAAGRPRKQPRRRGQPKPDRQAG